MASARSEEFIFCVGTRRLRSMHSVVVVQLLPRLRKVPERILMIAGRLGSDSRRCHFVAPPSLPTQPGAAPSS